MLTKSFSVLAALLAACAATANPLAAPAEASKQWERCVAAVDSKGAAISCAVGYQIDNPNDLDDVTISVPIFWPKSEPFVEATFLEKCRPLLEWDGRVGRPYVVRPVEDPEDAAGYLKVPEGMTLVFCYFSAAIQSEAKAVSIVASYWQPAGAQGVPYVPLFEDPAKVRDESLFTFTAFPVGDGALSLLSKHAGKSTVLKTRITVTPRHDEAIIISNGTMGAVEVPKPDF